jgi:hypothetical protein
VIAAILGVVLIVLGGLFVLGCLAGFAKGPSERMPATVMSVVGVIMIIGGVVLLP